ncbi:MAG: hypothetical protein NTV52_24010 [Acidobacteria bacterium]|nr:hypothetical protein [Acidobacteriota bacterium]
MAKYCPVCGAEFPDYANVCDQHGAALLARRRRYLWPLAAAAAVLLVAPLAARAWVSQQAVATITEVRLVKRADMNQVAIGASVVSPLGLPAGDYQLTFAGVVGQAQPATSGRIEWTVPYTDTVRRPPDAGIPVNLRGTLRIPLLGTEWSVPFERRFVVKLSF